MSSSNAVPPSGQPGKTPQVTSSQNSELQKPETKISAVMVAVLKEFASYLLGADPSSGKSNK